MTKFIQVRLNKEKLPVVLTDSATSEASSNFASLHTIFIVHMSDSKGLGTKARISRSAPILWPTSATF